MNLNKHLDFIKPYAYGKPIHIIGVGAVGSRVAELVVRLGFNDIHIYDFDIVEDGNITNQIYTYRDMGMSKEDALERILLDINPHLQLTKHGRYEKQPLEGAIFLAVDSIKTRREITKANIRNLKIDLFIDMRMRLTDGQVYTAVWKEAQQAHRFLNSMDFNDEDDLTPVSVCGTTLSVAPTVVTLVSIGIMNLMRYIRKESIREVAFLDLMEFNINTIVYKN
jgi:molybdopterin/thiamine biosynthesis adenylyltransferase